jgi:hypothetical protein
VLQTSSNGESNGLPRRKAFGDRAGQVLEQGGRGGEWKLGKPAACGWGERDLVWLRLSHSLMVWMSSNHWPLLGASAPNGVADYQALRDPLFLRAVWFTLKYTAVTTVVLGLVAFVPAAPTACRWRSPNRLPAGWSP